MISLLHQFDMANRYLHSFPTRRSSDLARHREEERRARRQERAQEPPAEVVRLADRRRVRSEEHTSELQSPCNLVCRLLLEKKNIRSIVKYTLLTNRQKH